MKRDVWREFGSMGNNIIHVGQFPKSKTKNNYMPELPEVESLRRGLEEFVVGQRVRNVEVLLGKIVSGRGTKRTNDESKVKNFCAKISGKKILSITRRAKNMMINLERGGMLLVHLKMTGQLVYKSNKDNSTVSGGHPIQLSDNKLPNKHTYIIFTLEDGVLYYNDVRQFGYVLYFDSIEEINKLGHFDDLGWEPLDEGFTLAAFTEKMKSKKGILKKLLLDQKVVVGLGNIYADEVCYEAGVRPDRKVETLSKKEIQKLYNSIIRIIPRAIELGGSSVADYLLADGSRGNYAHEHKVYKRGGKKCFKCGRELNKSEVAGRTTVYCGFDQK
ncbi:DNA-formamidopyrimidine glycosylase [Candidatus Gracilibacteria bacterium]|nr:DNA-formamidopyrimidine glycosylase [Candidatus Gracilibacteria bacterium]